MPSFLSEIDRTHIDRAVMLALEAEQAGNLPIGSVITLNDEIVGEGKNAIWFPVFNANRHAEIESLRSVSAGLWEPSNQLTLYTTLEPCIMCFGAILLHSIARVVFGSADPYGGASPIIDHLPTYFEEKSFQIEWFGPALPETCDPLLDRTMKLVEARRNLR